MTDITTDTAPRLRSLRLTDTDYLACLAAAAASEMSWQKWASTVLGAAAYVVVVEGKPLPKPGSAPKVELQSEPRQRFPRAPKRVPGERPFRPNPKPGK